MELRKKQPIGVELVKRGIVSETDIEKALEYQKEHPSRKIGDILYIQEAGNPIRLIEAIGDILGTKGMVLNANTVKINPTDYISLDIAKDNKAVPFEVSAGKIKVCFADNVKNRNMDNIRLLMLNKGLVMESYITFETNIERYLKTLEGKSTDDLQLEGRNDTVTSLVDSIIKTGINRRASDIHIEPMEDQVRVRYRIDGELFTAAKINKAKQQQVIGRLKAISNMHQEKQESQDGRILLYDDYNIRVSSQPNVYGEKFVLRLLKKNDNIKNIFDLGFPATEEELKHSINKKNSITIMAAPTGEGKTTSLYSIIDYLNSPEINITTIEDPVEIRIKGLNQIEIDENKSSFSASLRTVLRQDPDIILVGEIRDRETGEIAIQAGQTGHYVLSTIHTIDAIEVITRLRKLGLSDYDIASTLATSISQRLVRRLCTKCRKERPFNEEEKRIISTLGEKYHVDFDLNGTTYDAVGCKHCNNTGYYDRIGVFEILDITDEIKEEIMNGKSSLEIRKKALEQNYRPLVIDGIKKVIQGYTTLQELNKKLLFY